MAKKPPKSESKVLRVADETGLGVDEAAELIAMRAEKDKADVRVTFGGSQFMVQPISTAGKAWVDENVELEGWQWMGPAFAVDQHYVEDLVAGMQASGLEVDTSKAISL